MFNTQKLREGWPCLWSLRTKAQARVCCVCVLGLDLGFRKRRQNLGSFCVGKSRSRLPESWRKEPGVVEARDGVSPCVLWRPSPDSPGLEERTDFTITVRTENLIPCLVQCIPTAGRLNGSTQSCSSFFPWLALPFIVFIYLFVCLLKSSWFTVLY